MTWTKLPEQFLTDPALLEVSRGARLLYVESLVWSNAQGTDGRLPRAALARLTDEPDAAAAASALVTAGKWQMTATGWLIVDFLRDQLSAAEVEAQRASTAERQRRWRHHSRGEHDLCDPERCSALRNASTSRDASRNASTASTNAGHRNGVSRRLSVPVRSEPTVPTAREPRNGQVSEPAGQPLGAAPADREETATEPDPEALARRRRQQRRDLGRAIREAPTNQLRQRYTRKFEEMYGDRYPGVSFDLEPGAEGVQA